MLKKKLKTDVIKSCYDFYQNLLYLVKKSTSRKYQLVKVVVEFNRVTIKDTKIFYFTDKFSEEFVGYTIFSLINCFSNYDQVKLDENI